MDAVPNRERHEAVRVRHELRRRLLQVAAVESLSPHMRRIVLAGPELDGFVSLAADDHVKLLFPAPGQEKPSFGDPACAMRDYTPRRYDARANTLTIDFVLHGDGPGSQWATAARPGDWLGVGGPRGSLVPADDYDATLLVGDETALPAIARRIEEMQAGARVVALVEVADRHEERALPTAANASVTWLFRDGGPAGDPERLLRALAGMRLPDGDVQAWIAAEIEVARSLRRHLVEERGMPRASVRAAGYWRRGEAGAHTRIEE